MVSDERELIHFNVQNMDSAIQKSRAEQTYTLFKGLGDPSWLKNFNAGDTYVDKGFGSYSLDIKKAYQYLDFENPVVLELELERGMNALYIDEAEYEVLCPRDITYEIKKINRNYLSNGENRIAVYKIKILKE